MAMLHGTVYAHSARCQPCKARVGETTAVAHGGNPRMKALPPREATASLLFAQHLK
ncbi:hypothetical protein [Moorena producens]|uniref:hypothetical protein n=1 Tax=Moorena producens TaxID=1155739 RepID=UPI001314A032|nr:hypothetical protein [Moorena producens]